MTAQGFKTLLRLVAVLAVFCWGIVPSSAQTTRSPQTAQTTAQEANKSNNAKLTPTPGKMRGTTNEMRMAAAIRTADRKAQAQRKAAATATQGEVKQ
jgi:hypothetical protein